MELIQAHTRGVGGTATQPLPDYVAARYLLHEHNNTETAR
ncbi:hypothetical protein YIM_32260 [Amycolatopsis sp. YIM 10]|nr:hypothetical protein YIM_32260 [Amycolatopsis sp. YIM 10]